MSGLGACGLLGGLVSLGWAATASPPGFLIDQVVAVVDKDVITESELMLETRVSLIVRERERGLQIALGDLDDDLLKSSLDFLIGQILVAGHLRRLGSIDVADADVDQALQGFASSFPSDDAYRAFRRRFDVGEERLRAIFRRDLKNDRFITQRLRSLSSGAEGEAGHLLAQQAMARWLADLKKGAEIRRLGPSGDLELQ